MNTVRVISVEGYKAVRSRIWLASLLIGTMSPLLFALAYTLRRANLIRSGSYNWAGFEQNCLYFFSVFLACAMVGGLAGLALTDESRFNTLKSVLTSGITRSQYLFGKLLFVALWVVAEIAVLVLTIFIVGTALGLNGGDMATYWPALLTETVCLLTLVPIFFLVALRTNNFFTVAGIGIAFSFVTLLLNLFSTGRPYMGYFPGSTGTAYMLVYSNQWGSQYNDPLAWAITLSFYTIVAIIATWVVMQRRDVQ